MVILLAGKAYRQQPGKNIQYPHASARSFPPSRLEQWLEVSVSMVF